MTTTPAPGDLEELRAVAEKASTATFHVVEEKDCPFDGEWCAEKLDELYSMALHVPNAPTMADREWGEVWDDPGVLEFFAAFTPTVTLALLSEIDSLRSAGQTVHREFDRAKELLKSAKAAVSELEQEKEGIFIEYKKAEAEVASLRSDKERLEGALRDLAKSYMGSAIFWAIAKPTMDDAYIAGTYRLQFSTVEVLHELAAALNQEPPDGA